MINICVYWISLKPTSENFMYTTIKWKNEHFVSWCGLFSLSDFVNGLSNFINSAIHVKINKTEKKIM